jgi:TorA maturation chaperone TorD
LIDDRIRALDESDAVRELAVEFRRLFAGPRPACPPYESMQHGEAMIGDRTERRLKEYMHRHGMEAELPPDLPVLSYDHIAVHFALLHRLCDSPPSPPAPADRPCAADPFREFLQFHLLPWAPAYLHELRTESRLAPYRTIAELTARFLTEGHRI